MAQGYIVLFALCLIGSVLVLGQQESAAPSLPTTWRAGIATNYGSSYDKQDPNEPSAGTKEGSCGYGVLDKTKFPYWSVGALAQKNSYYLAGPQFGCGECFEVQCIQDGTEFAGRCNADPSARSLTMQITDSCPECDADHLDLQALAFNKIAPMAIGRISVKYRRVECVPPTGLTISVDTNAGTGNWIRMTVQKVAGTGSVSLVQVRGAGSNWETMLNGWGASWEMGVSPKPPLDLRVVSSDGTEVTAFGFIDASGEKGLLPVGVNFAAKKDPSVTPFTTLPGLVATDLSGAGEAAASVATSTITSTLGGDATASASSSSTSSDKQEPSSSTTDSQTVSAFDGPSGESPPPPSATTASPSPVTPPAEASPPSSSSPPSPPPTSYSCSDSEPPGSSYTCYQQKQWGTCYSSWMTQSSANYPKGYCAKTCGRC